jgi:hypothetical protein
VEVGKAEGDSPEERSRPRASVTSRRYTVPVEWDVSGLPTTGRQCTPRATAGPPLRTTYGPPTVHRPRRERPRVRAPFSAAPVLRSRPFEGEIASARARGFARRRRFRHTCGLPCRPTARRAGRFGGQWGDAERVVTNQPLYHLSYAGSSSHTIDSAMLLSLLASQTLTR